MAEFGRRKKPEALSDLTKDFLKNTGLDGDSRDRKIRNAWIAAAGENLIPHSRPVRLHGNRLTVEVTTSALAAELNGFLKQELLERLKATAPELAILDIKFKVKAV